jgi:glycosyltransferase involved in cell wall biosynthesis
MSSRVLIREDNTALPLKAAPPTQPGQDLRTVVIGRLVPVKGIYELLQALAAVTIPLVLDIYGPEEDEFYAQRCHRLAAELPPHISVSFKGAIHSAEVTNTLRKYDLMLLPSRGENFSHVVAEALSVSLPVMCADVTPWSSFVAAGGGVLLADNAVLTWTKSVEEYAGMSAAYKMSMRRTAGHQYERWRESTDEQPHIFDLINANRLGT